MFKKSILIYIAIYIVGHVIVSYASTYNCKGWSCKTVYCPDDYAVKLPSGEYLPCEKFNDYVNKKKVRLLE